MIDAKIYNSIFNSLIDEAYNKAFNIQPYQYYTTKDLVFKKEPKRMNVLTEETENNMLIKFTVPGVDKTTLQVELDPCDRTILVTGKYNVDTILDQPVKEKTYKEIVYLNNKKWDIEPEKTYLKEGILYIQFKKQEAFNKKFVNVDIS